MSRNPPRAFTPPLISIGYAFLLLLSACDSEDIKEEPTGTLWMWGYSEATQSGERTDLKRFPFQVGEDQDWKQISFGGQFALAVKRDGTLWSFETASEDMLPLQIGTDSDWIYASCGNENFFALKKDGTLWTWGDPTIQFGRGPAPPSTTPVQVNFEDTWVQVRAGAGHVVAKKRDGTYWAWGHNADGQVGDGTMEMKYLPQPLGNDWKEIVPGAFTTIGIKRDGTLWGWGSNGMGHFGTNGEPGRSYVPMQLVEDSRWEKISLGSFHALGVKQDGSLWAWGWNSTGAVGNGFADPSSVPITQVGSATDWKEVAAGSSHSLALKTNGTAYGWGANTFGQAGAGAEDVQVVPLEIPSDRPWLSIACGSNSGGIKE